MPANNDLVEALSFEGAIRARADGEEIQREACEWQHPRDFAAITSGGKEDVESQVRDSSRQAWVWGQPYDRGHPADLTQPIPIELAADARDEGRAALRRWGRNRGFR